ncbi:MAG: hypothetical protein ABIJ59_19075 [Pseudomonadota bacterium]
MAKTKEEDSLLRVKSAGINLRWYRIIPFVLFFIFIIIVIMEVTVRGFWHIRYGVPFRDPDLILYSYYPELRFVDHWKPSHQDDYLDILLLGGSVLDLSWGTVHHELREQLARAGYHKVRIFNLAKPAHTSRDSLLKYAALGQSRFELVVFYHGINESRTNNVPPELFRQDYSHYSWYEFVNDLSRFHNRAFIALPYTLRHMAIRLKQIIKKNNYILEDAPSKEWVGYGETINSAKSFENNLKAILELASKQNDKVMLMTFAVHIPADYTDEGFKTIRLDYLTHRFPVKLWGAPQNVLKSVTAHNEVVKRLISRHKKILFVDQANLMKKSFQYFNDACHLTTLGSSMFVKHLLEVFLPTLQSDCLPGNESKQGIKVIVSGKNKNSKSY